MLWGLEVLFSLLSSVLASASDLLPVVAMLVPALMSVSTSVLTLLPRLLLVVHLPSVLKRLMCLVILLLPDSMVAFVKASGPMPTLLSALILASALVLRTLSTLVLLLLLTGALMLRLLSQQF